MVHYSLVSLAVSVLQLCLQLNVLLMFLVDGLSLQPVLLSDVRRGNRFSSDSKVGSGRMFFHRNDRAVSLKRDNTKKKKKEGRI